MVSAIVLFVAFRRLLNLNSFENLGLKPVDAGFRELSIGVALALVSMAVLALVMTWSDVFIPFFRLSLSQSVSRCSGALLAGIAASSIEEVFFRGILLKGLAEDLGKRAGYLVSSAFFSAIHFVRPGQEIVLSQADAFAGMRHLVTSFEAFLHPLEILPGFIGLFLIALILCHAFERTGTLYASIGLHGGWIFALKTLRVFGNYTREDLGWIFGSGDPKIVSGVATWVGIALVGLAVTRMNWKPHRLALCQFSTTVGARLRRSQ